MPGAVDRAGKDNISTHMEGGTIKKSTKVISDNNTKKWGNGI